jgi:thiamine biosynthesis lipoprotein
MGTRWEITIWDKIGEKLFEEIKADVISSSKNFDGIYSRFKPDSFVRKISKESGKIKVPSDLVKMLSLYKELYGPSEGKLNPLVGQTLSDLGYDEKYSLKAKAEISPVASLDTVRIVGEEYIVQDSPVLLDFGALGKGYFVDTLKEKLLALNLKRFLINGSGDIFYSGDEPIRAGLEHPKDPAKVIGVKTLTTGALCASSNNRRSWGNYTHTIDPKTLNTKHGIIATWVSSASAALSDALATAFFLCNPLNFEGKYEFEYLLLNKEFKVNQSKGFNAELF